ncbi:MAG: hypothetical protein ABSD08_22520 [Xanthobacteraceae bacterium]|jgi:hypothetical protein
MRRGLGLLASALIVGAAIAACRPTGDVGYVEIKTVPVAPVTQTALYIDSAKLAPIKKGSAILRQRVGTLKLQADGIAGSLAPLCDIVVQRNRITTVTVSVLERPPRCQCRYSGTDAAHACVS